MACNENFKETVEYCKESDTNKGGLSQNVYLSEDAYLMEIEDCTKLEDAIKSKHPFNEENRKRCEEIEGEVLGQCQLEVEEDDTSWKYIDISWAESNLKQEGLLRHSFEEDLKKGKRKYYRGIERIGGRMETLYSIQKGGSNLVLCGETEQVHILEVGSVIHNVVEIKKKGFKKLRKVWLEVRAENIYRYNHGVIK